MASESTAIVPLKWTEENIAERRKRVNSLLANQFTEEQIALGLGVSRDTIIEDVKFLKDHLNEWLDEQGGTGFIWFCKMAIEKLEQMELEARIMLQERRKGRTLTTWEFILLQNRIMELTNLQFQIRKGGPTLQVIKKALSFSNIYSPEEVRKKFLEKKNQNLKKELSRSST